MPKRLTSLLKPLLAFALLTAAPLGAAADVTDYSQARPTDHGTGKIFMGREIAQAIDSSGADWLERPERAQEEGTDKLIPLLKLKPTDAVADIGAGTGYFSFRLAKALPGGKVYAEDIDHILVDTIKQRQAAGEAANVVPILGTISDPGLPPASIDLALMVDVWHELLFPREMGQALMKALKPGGRIALVEYRDEDPDSPILPLHRMSVIQARAEMATLGFRWVSTDSKSLPIQHVMIFERP